MSCETYVINDCERCKGVGQLPGKPHNWGWLRLPAAFSSSPSHDAYELPNGQTVLVQKGTKHFMWFCPDCRGRATKADLSPEARHYAGLLAHARLGMTGRL